MNDSNEISEISIVFQGAIPLIFRIMDERGVLPIYWPVIKDALVMDTGIKDARVKEGLMVAFSSRCDNSYCFITHSYFLYGLGFTVDDIEKMVHGLKFPPQIDDHEKWSSVLKWAYLFGYVHSSAASSNEESDKFIRELISEDEYRHLFKICGAVTLLNRFSEFYADQVRIDEEEMFFDSEKTVQLPIPDLAQFYENISHSNGEVERPVVQICSYCRDIGDTEGNWHALESILPALDRNSSFTHGICPACYQKEFQEIASSI